MKIYGGTKAMKRKLVVSFTEDLIGAGALCFGGMLVLKFVGAIFALLGVA